MRVAGEGRLLAFEVSSPPNGYSIDIWSVASRSRVSHIPMPGELSRLVFNSSGTILFTAQDEKLQAWDIPSGKQRFSLNTGGDIEFIIPGPSTAFATITRGQLTVWDSATGDRFAQLPDARYLRAAAFSPDERYLLTGYDEHSAALWLWRSEDLRDQACARLTSNLSHDEWGRWLSGQPYHPTCPSLQGAL
jgi:WD40 repeat protein